MIDIPFTGVSVDSRLTKPGDLFFALKGDKTDGHLFLDQAAKNGAIAAVVNQDYTGLHQDLLLIHVESPLQSLQSLARSVLASRKTKIVGITGSVGKTTTKEFLTILLQQKYRTACSPGNYNSQIGIPLTIFNHTKGDEEILVLEMGMTHPGNISKLVNIAPPDIAILTTVALVHAGNFNSLEEIALAKSEIFSHPKTKVALIDREVEKYFKIIQLGSCRKLSFSLVSNNADYFFESFGENELVIRTSFGEGERIGSFHLQGNHNQHNLLAAIAAARDLGLSWDDIRKGVALLSLPENRLQSYMHKGIHFINDAYNSSPIAVKAALTSLPNPEKGGKRIAVLGDMLELGHFSAISHEEIAHEALNYVDALYCFGQECRHMIDIWKQKNRPVHWFENRVLLVEALRDDLKAGDVVLIKGSRGTQAWKILQEYLG